jgi:transcriptional regulator CtsR
MILYEDAASQASKNTSKDAWRKIIGRLQNNALITSREAALLIEFFHIIERRFDDEECGVILKSLLLTLATKS